MGKLLTTGQITIIDYNDAVSLSAYITCDKPRTQIFNPDNASYSPDWYKENLILEPFLFKSGSGDNLINTGEVTSVQWFELLEGYDKKQISKSDGWHTLEAGHKLRVFQNMLSEGINSVTYTAEISFRDSSSGLILKTQATISFCKLASGGGITTAIAKAPRGNIFKNGAIKELTAECSLFRGAKEDTTDVSYQWFEQDPENSKDEGAGAGWRKLTSTTAQGCKGYTTKTMTIPCDAVESLSTFKCVITDLDASSNTRNKSFYDIITFADFSDPIKVELFSSTGTVFKSGMNNKTVLTAKLYQNGIEIDTDGSKYEYEWFSYSKEGNLVPNFGGSNVNYRKGKVITVTDSDVNTKNSFWIEVKEK